MLAGKTSPLPKFALAIVWQKGSDPG